MNAKVLTFHKSQHLNPAGISHAFGKSSPGIEEMREYVITPQGDGTFTVEVRYAVEGEPIEATLPTLDAAEAWANGFEFMARREFHREVTPNFLASRTYAADDPDNYRYH